MTTPYRRHTYYGSTISTNSNSNNNNNNNNNIHNNSNLHSKTNQTKIPSFGPYLIGSTLGQGEFGKVKLGWSKTTKSVSSNSNINNQNGTTTNLYGDISKQVAIKLIKRDTILNDKAKEIKIYREINALKQLSHPNIVKLEEVLQNSKYIGIVLEYASGGEFYKYIQIKKRLKEQLACKLFAQLISGVNYIHSKGLVHRDLKLENLLLDKNENLIITDFGFVNEYYTHNELMKTSCGSPCYAAPELVISTKPYEGRKADVWSCGIILFAMLAGYLPWDDDVDNPDGEDIARLYYYILNTPLKFPEYISPIPRDLLRRILVTNPSKRVGIKEIESHQWLIPHVGFLSISPDEWSKISQSRNILRLPKHSKQFSQRPRSTCSMSSGGSKNGDKRDSLIMDSALFSFPAPPRECQSNVLAMQPSTSIEQIEVGKRSPIKRGHSRSNSAASVALQAFVDAEREFHQQQSPQPQDNFQNSPKISQTSFERHSNSGVNFTFPQKINGNSSQSNVHYHNNNALSKTYSMYDKENIIVETSPIKPMMRNKSLTDSAIDLVPLNPSLNRDNSSVRHIRASSHSPFMTISPSRSGNLSGNNCAITLTTNNLINNGNGNFSSNTNNSSKFNSHLSINQRKPRPTSYYPGLFSPVLEREQSLSLTNTPTITQQGQPPSTLNSANTTNSSNQLATSPFDIIPNLNCDTAVTSTKSCEVSPKLLPRRSSSINSRISIDMEGAYGDLLKSKYDMDTLIKKVQEQVINEEKKSFEINSGQLNNKVKTVGEKKDNVDDIKRDKKGGDEDDTIKYESLQNKINESQTEIKIRTPVNKTKQQEKKRYSFFSLYAHHYGSNKPSNNHDLNTKKVGNGSNSNSPTPNNRNRHSSYITRTKQNSYSYAYSLNNQNNSKRNNSNNSTDINNNNLSGNKFFEYTQHHHNVSPISSNSPIKSRNQSYHQTSKRDRRHSLILNPTIHESVIEIENDGTDNDHGNIDNSSTAKKVIDFFKRKSVKI